jgi:trans-aconitate 2-methyltransferase
MAGARGHTQELNQAPEWDADAYHRLSDPQTAWGQRLLDTVTLRGDEIVIDAGCGTGRLTRLILERLPRGRVIAVDVSQRMLETARRNLESDFHGRVEYLQSDLLDLTLAGVADLVFSTATFHWVPDHPRLFRVLAAALRKEGQLVAQLGGKGNLDRLHARAERIMAEPAYASSFREWERPWRFPDERQAADDLEAAGFREVRAVLFPEPTTFPDAGTYRQFITTVNFRAHLTRISEERLRDEYINRLVAAAATDDPPFTLDYWRLNLRALRG